MAAYSPTRQDLIELKAQAWDKHVAIEEAKVQIAIAIDKKKTLIKDLQEQKIRIYNLQHPENPIVLPVKEE